MKLLLHTCCGTCLMYPHELLKDEFEITAYYYNPNIQPSGEYLMRLDSLKTVCSEIGAELVSENYDPKPFFTEVDFMAPHPDRCLKCYELRLGKTAEYAKTHGYSDISTTLLISPYQQHEELARIGRKQAEEAGLHFYYRDFRPGFNEARNIAKSRGVYQQKYCGCLFSDFESYMNRRR